MKDDSRAKWPEGVVVCDNGVDSNDEGVSWWHADVSLKNGEMVCEVWGDTHEEVKARLAQIQHLPAMVALLKDLAKEKLWQKVCGVTAITDLPTENAQKSITILRSIGEVE